MKLKSLPLIALAITLFVSSCSSFRKFECREDLKGNALAKKTTEAPNAFNESPQQAQADAATVAEQAPTNAARVDMNSPAPKLSQNIQQHTKNVVRSNVNSNGKVQYAQPQTQKKSVAKKLFKKNIFKSLRKDDTSIILLYILAVLIPPIAVGIVTDWEFTPLLISILLCILGYLPGIVYAIYMVYKKKGGDK